MDRGFELVRYHILAGPFFFFFFFFKSPLMRCNGQDTGSIVASHIEERERRPYSVVTIQADPSHGICYVICMISRLRSDEAEWSIGRKRSFGELLFCELLFWILFSGFSSIGLSI